MPAASAVTDEPDQTTIEEAVPITDEAEAGSPVPASETVEATQVADSNESDVADDPTIQNKTVKPGKRRGIKLKKDI
ncbi:MAG: hypothetical protein R3E95_01735 [Thiolinea sp.]